MKAARRDLLIIGGGPAGLAAAVAAYDAGLRDILLVERDRALGGILNQCIHNGFGLHKFREELTGPEYADRYIKMFEDRGIELRSDGMVLDLSGNRIVTMVSPEHGLEKFRAEAVVLAMGSRERTRGAIGTPGTRPAGVMTAGAAQRYVNLEGLNVGRNVLILGSGDIGLIMARRMVYEGAKVHACVEVMSSPGGLTRNIVQCLEDFGIPLLLSHTVTRIIGSRRLEAVEIAAADLQLQPIRGTERIIPCDTLLLSVGLIPENELSRAAGVELDPRTAAPIVDERFMTSVPGIFACGNVLHIHDLVDHVSEEAERAGAAAAAYVRGGEEASAFIRVLTERGIRYSVPQKIGVRERLEDVTFRFRVTHTAADQQFIVKTGETVLTQYRRPFVTPGEMVSLKVPGSLLKRAEPAEPLTLAMHPYMEDSP